MIPTPEPLNRFQCESLTPHLGGDLGSDPSQVAPDSGGIKHFRSDRPGPTLTPGSATRGLEDGRGRKGFRVPRERRGQVSSQTRKRRLLPRLPEPTPGTLGREPASGGAETEAEDARGEGGPETLTLAQRESSDRPPLGTGPDEDPSRLNLPTRSDSTLAVGLPARPFPGDGPSARGLVTGKSDFPLHFLHSEGGREKNDGPQITGRFSRGTTPREDSGENSGGRDEEVLSLPLRRYY